MDVVAVREHPACEGRLHPGNRPHQRGLAGAVGPEQAHQLAFAQFERDVRGEDGLVASAPVADGQSFEGEHARVLDGHAAHLPIAQDDADDHGRSDQRVHGVQMQDVALPREVDDQIGGKAQ